MPKKVVSKKAVPVTKDGKKSKGAKTRVIKKALKKPSKPQKVKPPLRSTPNDTKKKTSSVKKVEVTKRKASQSPAMKKNRRKKTENDVEIKVSTRRQTKSRSRDIVVGAMKSFQEGGTPFQSLLNDTSLKSLKIISWNVNGVRAWLNHNGLEFVKKSTPDVFCIQETKCPEIPALLELPNYRCYWLSGDRDGYSGVAVLTKVKPIKVTCGIGVSEHDSEGRILCLEFSKFILVAAYIPNAGRNLVRLPYRESWDDEFRKFINKLKKPVVLCGDLNVAHQEIDLRNPKSNTKIAGFTKEERQNFSKMLEECDLTDSFRYLHPDEKDAYTFWSYMRNSREKNIGWRVDYFLLSSSLVPNLKTSSILSEVMGSDHCPIELVMSF